MYCLSILYAHLWYDDLEIYCDEKSAEVFKILPIKITVIDFTETKELWMDSKMKVIELQQRPFIHIDGDVFLQKPIPVFHNLSSQVIVERVEDEENFKLHYKEQVEFLDDYFEGILRHWKKDLGYSYNCGTIGFSDIILKTDFIEQYKSSKSIFKDISKEYYEFKSNNGYEPCIVLEQYNLATFLNYRGIKPQILIDSHSIDGNNIFSKRLGYCHLYGNSKYDLKESIEERLKLAFSHWYYKIIDKLNLSL
jgi:hypothetical protein